MLSDPAKRKEYDETRRLFAGGGFGRAVRRRRRRLRRVRRRRRRVQPRRPVRRGRADRRRQHRRPVRRTVRPWRAQPRPSRPRRGNDLETETELSFLEATKGVAMPLRLTSPAPCTNCHGSGARPGTSPKVCPNCNGVRRHQPQPGCVRVLRTVHRLPGQRLDHRGPVRRVPGHRRDHPDPHHQRADPAGRRGRSADPAGRAGRGRSARRAVGRPVRHRARAAGQGVRPRRRRPDGHRAGQLSRTGLGHNAFGADAGRQGRCAGAQGHVRRPHPAGARPRCAEALRRPRRPAGHRQGRGAAEPGRRGGRGAGGLREGRAGQRIRSAGRMGRYADEPTKRRRPAPS